MVEVATKSIDESVIIELKLSENGEKMRKIVGLMAIFVSIMLVAPRCVYSAPSLTDGLVGYWNFDEGSGIIANDTSGNDNDGLLINSPAWTTGKLGNALNFSGTNYVDCGNAASLHVQNYSLTAWIKPSSIPILEYRIISNGVVGTFSGAVDFGFDSGGRLFIVHENVTGEDTCYSQAGSLFPVDVWSFVAVTYDATTEAVLMYVNQGVVSTTINTMRVPNPNPSYNMRIATMGNPVTRVFQGSIDEVRLYNRTLAPEEIMQVIPEFPSGLILPLFVVLTTIVGVIVYTRRHREQTNVSFS